MEIQNTTKEVDSETGSMDNAVETRRVPSVSNERPVTSMSENDQSPGNATSTEDCLSQCDVTVQSEPCPPSEKDVCTNISTMNSEEENETDCQGPQTLETSCHSESGDHLQAQSVSASLEISSPSISHKQSSDTVNIEHGPSFQIHLSQYTNTSNTQIENVCVNDSSLQSEGSKHDVDRVTVTGNVPFCIAADDDSSLFATDQGVLNETYSLETKESNCLKTSELIHINKNATQTMGKPNADYEHQICDVSCSGNQIDNTNLFSGKALGDLGPQDLDKMQQDGQVQSATDESNAVETGAKDMLAAVNKEKCEARDTLPEVNDENSQTGSNIASIQSLSGSQPGAAKDMVQISRAELTFMVKQTLMAHTMRNYLDTQMQSVHNPQDQYQTPSYRKGTEKETKTSHGFPQEVFQFPGSLPPVYIQPSGICPSPLMSQSTGQSSGKQHTASSPLQADGDLASTSLQLPSQLSFDGDPQANKETAPPGAISHILHFTNTASSTSGPSQIPQQNIPDMAMLEAANVYSLGPQQAEDSKMVQVGVSQEKYNLLLAELERMKRHANDVTPGMSREIYQLQSDELEKLRRFVHKIVGEGGLHPNTVQEVVDLRDKFNKLHTENVQLKTELQNQATLARAPPLEDKNKVQDLEAKLQGQKKREIELLQMITKIGKENKELKSKFLSHSQPSSSVGYLALPTTIIPPTITPITASVDCQTEARFVSEEEHALRMAVFQNKNAQLHDQYVQFRNRDAESREALKKINAELRARNTDNFHLQHSVRTLQQDMQNSIQDKKQLDDQIMGLINENDKQKRKLSQEAARNRHLEKIIDDERKRYARDEKELLDRVRLSSTEIRSLRHLVVTVEKARREGTQLPPESADQVAAALRRNDSSDSSSSTSSAAAARQPSSRGGKSGLSPSASQTNSGNVRTAQRGGGHPSSGRGNLGQLDNGQGNSGSGRGSRATSASQSSAGPTSLPPSMSRQTGSEVNRNSPAGGPVGSQAHRNSPPQRNIPADAGS